MKYIPVDKNQAENLSKALYKLMVPNAPSNYVSCQYCDVIKHDTNDLWLLAMPESDNIPVHLQADPQPLIDCLTPFVAGGQITQAELDGIVEAVQMLKGNTFNPASLVPASWEPYVMNFEQAQIAGYFPND